MSRIIFLISISAIILTGCAPVDILYTAPKSGGIKEDEAGRWMYENDTIKITYTFWAEQGAMAMVVENKLDVPLYIDWKKSAYIDKKHKLDYYSENLTAKTISDWVDAPYLYRSAYDWNRWYPVNLGISISEGSIEKQERVSFIPPHANNGWLRYKLTAAAYVTLKNATREYVEVAGRKKKIKAQVIKADKDNANMFFSNFLTYSTRETFESEKYVDNQFYVSQMVRVPKFWFESFKDSKRFYITDYGN